MLTVEIGGPRVRALVYVGEQRGRRRPMPGYQERVVAAAEDWKLPPRYVAELAPPRARLSRGASGRDRRDRMIVRRVVVHGRVQGVGFRAFVEDTAERLGLEGWVRNRRDGTVEAVFAGPEPSVTAALEACRAGPRHGHVDRIDVEEARFGAVEPAPSGRALLGPGNDMKNALTAAALLVCLSLAASQDSSIRDAMAAELPIPPRGEVSIQGYGDSNKTLPGMDRRLPHLHASGKRRRRSARTSASPASRRRSAAPGGPSRRSSYAGIAAASSVAPNSASNSRRSTMSTSGIVTGWPRSTRLVTP